MGGFAPKPPRPLSPFDPGWCSQDRCVMGFAHCITQPGLGGRAILKSALLSMRRGGPQVFEPRSRCHFISSERSSIWQSAWFGSRRLWVQIPLFRPSHLDVAQAGRARVLGTRGRRFDSVRPDHRYRNVAQSGRALPCDASRRRARAEAVGSNPPLRSGHPMPRRASGSRSARPVRSDHFSC
jgi:hypothetical protein